jgi:hypothetical protein
MDGRDPVIDSRAADHLAASDMVPGAHGAEAEVGVGGAYRPAVVDRDARSARHLAGEGDDPRSRRPDRRPIGNAEVDPPVPTVCARWGETALDGPIDGEVEDTGTTQGDDEKQDGGHEPAKGIASM